MRLKYLFNSKQIDHFWICSSVQTINSVAYSRLLKYSSSSIRVPSESKNRWSISAFIIWLARWKRWSTFSTAVGILSIWFLSEAVVQRCSVKKTFLEISQNSQENFVKFLRTSFLTKSLWWLLLFYHDNSTKTYKDHLYCRLFFTSKYFLSGNKHCFYFQLSSLQKYFFKATILGKIFRTKWRNPVKLDRTTKVWYLLLRLFWLLLPKFNLWKGDWALGYVSIQIWDFPNISLFPKILILKWFGNSWGNSYTKFAILDITFRFTCG